MDVFESYLAAVLANREQVERLRTLNPPAGGDFWAGGAPTFSPGVLEAEEMPALEALARPDDTWLDVGAGGGRFAVPLSRLVARLVAVEPSPAMRAVLDAAFAADGRTNYEVHDLHWPPAPGIDAPSGDVSLVANVLYDAAEARTFLDALERHTRRLCVVITSDRAPSTPDPRVWEALYGEPLCALPGLPAFLALLGALGRRFDIRTFPVRPPEPVTADRAVEDLRWRYWVQPGTPLEARLRDLLIEHYGEPSGLLRLPPRRNYTAVISWAPDGT